MAGGVGGARLAHGLAAVPGVALSVIVNTGDDFDHLGLRICPDIDTVLYTLGGIANRAQGWGIEGETWNFLGQLERLGAPSWFRLGDRDLATHLLRTQRLHAGERLTCIVSDLAARIGVRSTILPMTDDMVRTIVATADGDLSFQDYFVRLQCNVAVNGFRFDGIDQAQPSSEVLAALAAPHLTAVIICPSNPYVSVAPILSVAGMRAAIRSCGAPIVAVSPIIGGAAVKGPAAKMMRELGHSPSALAIAQHYAGFIDGLVIDEVDSALQDAIEALEIPVLVTRTLMLSDADRQRLAEDCLAFAAGLTGSLVRSRILKNNSGG